MKRLFASAALVSAALLAAMPIAAQQQQSGADQAVNLSYMDCAVWAAVRIGQAPEGTDTSGLGHALAYFIGLYEGESGEQFEPAMRERTNRMTLADIDRLDAPCREQMATFGSRLSNWGNES
jgi:uncharacterized low-complexity protein